MRAKALILALAAMLAVAGTAAASSWHRIASAKSYGKSATVSRSIGAGEYAAVVQTRHRDLTSVTVTFACADGERWMHIYLFRHGAVGSLRQVGGGATWTFDPGMHCRFTVEGEIILGGSGVAVELWKHS